VAIGLHSGAHDERAVHAARLLEKAASPPKLWSMANVLLVSYLSMALSLAFVMAVAMWIMACSKAEVWIVAVWLVFDAAAATMILAMLGRAVTSNVSDRRYFNYKLEGLRAIRAVRHILVSSLLVLTLVPFACALTAKKTHSAMMRIEPYAARALVKVQRTVAGSPATELRGLAGHRAGTSLV
jgi:hypothetical protein